MPMREHGIHKRLYLRENLFVNGMARRFVLSSFLFGLIGLLLVPSVAAASDCAKANMYMQLARSALVDADAYAGRDDRASASLGVTSAKSAEHFADVAGEYFQEDECGPELLLRWFGFQWMEDADFAPDRARNSKQVSTDIAAGKALLRKWTRLGYPTTYSDAYAFAASSFHDVQLVASTLGLNPNTGKKAIQRHQGDTPSSRGPAATATQQQSHGQPHARSSENGGSHWKYDSPRLPRPNRDCH